MPSTDSTTVPQTCNPLIKLVLHYGDSLPNTGRCPTCPARAPDLDTYCHSHRPPNVRPPGPSFARHSAFVTLSRYLRYGTAISFTPSGIIVSTRQPQGAELSVWKRFARILAEVR